MEDVKECLRAIVGNDNGNSMHKIIINGERILAPNTNCLMHKILDATNTGIDLEEAIKHLPHNILVTITSNAVKQPGIYTVGELAQKMPDADFLGIDGQSKHSSDLPIINTLAQIAVHAVRQSFRTHHTLPEEIEVSVEMTTALPCTQFETATAKLFAAKFEQHKHLVTVHLSGISVLVKLSFEGVTVLPEASSAIFAMKDIPELHTYAQKKILHLEIGDGTTELPVTEGGMLLKEYLDGGNYGIGHAIEKALPDFRKECFLTSCNRHYFSKVLADQTNKYHASARKHLAIGLVNQAKLIHKKVQTQLSLLRNEVDILFVYGGGSIPLKAHLEELLAETTKQAAVEVVFCPPEYAVELNARGLYAFTQSPIFQTLTKKDGEKRV